MELLQVNELQSGETFIKFKIDYPTVQTQKQLKVLVQEQRFNFSANKPDDQIKLIKLCEILFESDEKTKILPPKIIIEDLPSGKLFKFNFSIIDEENYKQDINIFSSTQGIAVKQDSLKENITDITQTISNKILKNKLLDPVGNIAGLCESENILSKFASIKNIGLETFDSEKEIASSLLDARQSKGSKNYINSSYKFAKPKDLSQLRKKRAFLIAYQNEMMEEIFGFQREYKNGKEFGNNDWFMGPFYSYANNVNFQ